MTRRDILRLSGETGADPRTIKRWLAGEHIAIAAVEYALEAGCAKLGLPLPTPNAAPSSPPQAASGER